MQLQGTMDDIVAILSRVQAVLPTVRTIVMDPAFFDVAKRFQTLHEIEAAKPGASQSDSVGVGLKQFLMPLDALIYVRRNPWALWAGLAGAVVIIGGIGYRLGQRKTPR